jgi:hypothetical protein
MLDLTEAVARRPVVAPWEITSSALQPDDEPRLRRRTGGHHDPDDDPTLVPVRTYRPRQLQ